MDKDIAVNPKSIQRDLMCPICLETLNHTMTTRECLHRFCAKCIEKALRKGNKECPTCRKKLTSRRCLRADPNIDQLINKLFCYQQPNTIQAKQDQPEYQSRQIELVLEPVEQEENSSVRYIKCSPQAKIYHLIKYLSMRPHSWSKTVIEKPRKMKHIVYVMSKEGQLEHLNGETRLANVMFMGRKRLTDYIGPVKLHYQKLTKDKKKLIVLP